MQIGIHLVVKLFQLLLMQKLKINADREKHAFFVTAGTGEEAIESFMKFLGPRSCSFQLLFVLVGDIETKTIQVVQLPLDLFLAFIFIVKYLTGGFLPFCFGLMLKGLKIQVGEMVEWMGLIEVFWPYFDISELKAHWFFLMFAHITKQ